MKDFEFITAREHMNICLSSDTVSERVDKINKLINEKAEKVFYTEVNSGFADDQSNIVKKPHHTHMRLSFSTSLINDCDHIKCVSHRSKLISGKFIEKIQEFDFCPKCGEKLNAS